MKPGRVLCGQTMLPPKKQESIRMGASCELHKGEVHHCRFPKQVTEVQVVVPLLWAAKQKREAAEQDPG